jgi:hypothetical protein
LALKDAELGVESANEGVRSGKKSGGGILVVAQKIGVFGNDVSNVKLAFHDFWEVGRTSA